jgi:hypothetical protein
MLLQHTEAQEINRLWAVPATLAGMSLRKATKFDELGPDQSSHLGSCSITELTGRQS